MDHTELSPRQRIARGLAGAVFILIVAGLVVFIAFWWQELGTKSVWRFTHLQILLWLLMGLVDGLVQPGGFLLAAAYRGEDVIELGELLQSSVFLGVIFGIFGMPLVTMI